MSEHIITGADEVELVLKSDVGKVGTPGTMRRIVVDDFSITHEEGNSSQGSVGRREPAGLVYGVAEYGFSFTMLGSDKKVFEMIATNDGLFNTFSFTARKTDDTGAVEWEFALDQALPTSQEPSASTGEAMEYAVEGIAFRLDETT